MSEDVILDSRQWSYLGGTNNPWQKQKVSCYIALISFLHGIMALTALFLLLLKTSSEKSDI